MYTPELKLIEHLVALRVCLGKDQVNSSGKVSGVEYEIEMNKHVKPVASLPNKILFLLKDQVNPFMPTVLTFAVRETDVSRHNGGTSGALLKPLRDDSALRALYRL